MKRVKEELANIPIATNEDLAEADDIVFGTPTRYGNMCAQMKQFVEKNWKLGLKKTVFLGNWRRKTPMQPPLYQDLTQTDLL